MLHLNGLSFSPSATPSKRRQISQIMTVLETIHAWLQQVHQDVKQLATMTDQQLQQPEVAYVLNDLTTMMSNVLVGKQNAATGETEQGVKWVTQAILSLATVEIMPYPGSSENG